MTRHDTKWVELGFLPVNVGYVPNKRAWRKTLKQMKRRQDPFPESDGSATVWANVDPNHTTVILITIGKRASGYSVTQVAGLIAHECMHTWRYIREAIGEKEPSSEFEAYVLQALVQNIAHAHQTTRRKPWRKTL